MDHVDLDYERIAKVLAKCNSDKDLSSDDAEWVADTYRALTTFRFKEGVNNDLSLELTAIATRTAVDAEDFDAIEYLPLLGVLCREITALKERVVMLESKLNQ